MLIKYKIISKTLLLIAVLAPLFFSTSRAGATSLNYTDHLMDDSTFRASFTMTANDIQNFLVSKNSGLSNFSDVESCGSTSGSHYSYYATYFTCGSTQLASKIIYDAAQAYGINPQVILATLQKEESLITTPNPVASQLNYAMGYGCPDSGGCSYPGFFTQVDNATWQFRFDYERLTGGSTWWNSNTSYPCLSGGTPVHSNGGNIGAGAHYYSTGLIPGNNVTFFDYNGDAYAQFVLPNASTSALYCYTPHVFPGSSANYFSGSYWFVYYFSQWFGSPAAPYAFKSPTNGTVYIFASGYKIAVPSMAMLQDYGISPGSIQVIDQATVNSIATPDSLSGVSAQLSYLLKSPTGNTVYLVSLGQRYTLASFQQYTDFGFNSNEISYLPQSFIDSIANGGTLSNFLQTPSSNVFQVSGGLKRIIFDSATYVSLNTTGSISKVSGYVAGTIPSGLPITNREILVGNTKGTIYLLLNGAYYALPSLDTYYCWGFSQLGTPGYMLSDDSFVAAIYSSSNLSCANNTDASTMYLLNTTNKILVPRSLGFSAPIVNSDLASLLSKLPTRSNQLGQIVKTTNSPTVWYLESGIKKAIPSLSDFALLGLSGSQIDNISVSASNALPASGIKLGIGQVVMTNSSGTVYVTTANNTRTAIASSDDFIAYGYSWYAIEVFNPTTLDQQYPATSGLTISKYLYDQPSNVVYLVDRYGCHSLNASQLTSYGQVQSSIQTSQTYSSTIFHGLNLATCTPASTFVRSPDLATVYWVDGGVKHPISSWGTLVAKSGSSNPYITFLSESTLSMLPTSTTL